MMPSIGPPPLAADGTTPLNGIMEFRLKPVPDGKLKNIVRLLRDENKLNIDEVHLHFEEFVPRTYKIAVSASDMVVAVLDRTCHNQYTTTGVRYVGARNG